MQASFSVSQTGRVTRAVTALLTVLFAVATSHLETKATAIRVTISGRLGGAAG